MISNHSKTVLVVDVANVMGSRPDGWWRDRVGAASRLLSALALLPGTEASAPRHESGKHHSIDQHDSQDFESLRISRIIAVTEGQARTAAAPAQIDVVAAPADGDSTIVATTHGVLAGGDVPVVVTADRGLRDRLPAGSRTIGPSWLLDLL